MSVSGPNLSARVGAVGDGTLNAYVDGELTGAELGAVEAYLAARPSEAQTVHQLLEQDARLRSWYGSIGRDDLPPHLAKLSGELGAALASRPARPRRRFVPWLAFATGMAVSALVVAPLAYVASTSSIVLVGVTNEGPANGAPAGTLAIAAPVEPAASISESAPAIRVFPAGLPVPNFESFGFKPDDARPVDGTDGRAVELRYRSALGETLSLFVVPRGVLATDRILASHDGKMSVVLQDKANSYLLVSDADSETVLALGKFLDENLATMPRAITQGAR